MKKTRISIVSYLNSKPFLYGIERMKGCYGLELSLDIPSKVAVKLENNLADIGLIPVAGLLKLKDYRIVSRYCIGAVGPVRSVMLFSQVPLDEIETVLMDYQSRTSVMLARVLARYFWKKEWKWENTCADFQHKSIQGRTAGVLIGDRVFEMEGKFPYAYDLSEQWHLFTGLPFVFAVWASNRELSPELEEAFNKMLGMGFDALDEVIAKEQLKYPHVDIRSYLTESISFSLDEEKQKAMTQFLELAKTIQGEITA